MDLKEVFQDESWNPVYLKKTLGLFSWEGICTNVLEDSTLLEPYLPSTPFSSVIGQLEYIRNNFDIKQKIPLQLVRAILTEAHESSHFKNAVGTPIGLSGYVLNYNQIILGLIIIEQVGKNNNKIFMPMPEWLKNGKNVSYGNDPEIISYHSLWKSLSNQFNLYFTDYFFEYEIGQIKMDIPGFGYKFSSPSTRVFPATPKSYSTNHILEALAVCEETFLLGEAGYSHEETMHIIGNRPEDMYFSLLGYLHVGFNLNGLSIKLALKLSLLSDLEPYYSKKLGLKSEWKDIFPPWRLMKIADAMRKIGQVTVRMSNDDADLENYLDKLCDYLSWPHVRRLFDVGASADFATFYEESKNDPYRILSKNPIFVHMLETHKTICKISQKSPTYRFFDTIEIENLKLTTKVEPPFKIYNNEVLKPDWLDPEKFDSMFEYFILGTAVQEVLTSSQLEFTRKWSEVFFQNKEKSELYLEALWMINFKKSISDFLSFR
jgi:hypothetical protein